MIYTFPSSLTARVLSMITLFITWKCSHGGSSVLNLVFPNNDPLSVCQDGTPSVYYFLPYTDASLRDNWIFHLQGGGQCFSEETCANRGTSQGPTYNTSLNYGPTLSIHGIFDNDPSLSPLYGVNKVYVPYCSSDAWIGDSAPVELNWYNHLRGQRIIRSALVDIIDKGYLQENCNFIFSGSSKGASGIMNNIHNLVPLLPLGCKALAFLDSPYDLDYPVLTDYNITWSLVDQAKSVFDRFNVSAVIPPACSLKYSGDQAWKCIYGQYRMAFMETQYVMVSSLFDKYQLRIDVGGVDPVDNTYLDPNMTNYALQWSQVAKIALTQLVQSNVLNRRNNWILSWACYSHDTCPSTNFPITSVQNVTEYTAVQALMNGEISSPALFIDNCDGFACGNGCT